MGIELESTTFKQVQRILGRSPERKVVFQEELFKEVCYRGKDGTILQLMGPVKGDLANQVLIASLGTSIYTPPPKNCATSLKVDKKAQYKTGLRLGMSYLEMKKILGKPSFHRQDLLSYRFIHRFKKAGQTYEEVVEIWPEFVKDQLVFLKISKSLRK